MHTLLGCDKVPKMSGGLTASNMLNCFSLKKLWNLDSEVDDWLRQKMLVLLR